MRLTTHYHTFLHYIELTDIKDNLNLVKMQLSQIEERLDNNSHSLFDYQLEHLNSKIDKASSQIISLEPHRSKRGLIDGLGSVIKSISGNLDYTDAIKYDNALMSLQNNQNKIITEYNTHISLSKEFMDEHNHIITKLEKNQIQLNRTMHILFDSGYKYAQYTLLKFAKFAQVLLIINDNLDYLLSELSRLENILAFSNQSHTHHSLLSLDVMNKIIGRLKSFYGNDEILDLEPREYYDVIKPAYYYSKNRIVFAFRFPIVSPLIFSLYKLVIVPNKIGSAIIPPFPFLATTNNIHVYIEAECPKFKLQYLCEEKLNHQTRTHQDCISEIIQGQAKDPSCKETTIKLTKPAMEKLDDRHYAIVFPSSTRVRLTCERDESITLSGSYLVTIPRSCKLHTQEFTVINTDDHIKGQPMKITNISTKFTQEVPPHSPQPLEVDAINLQKLYNIQDRFNMQKPIYIEPTSLYHTTIPFYSTIVIGAVIVFIVILYRKYTQYKEAKNKYNEAETPPTKIGEPAGEPATQSQSKTSSIFHLKC